MKASCLTIRPKANSMKHLFLIVLITCVSSLYAQLKTGIRGYYGWSIVLNDQTPIRPPKDTYPTTYDYNFGGGAYLQYGFNDWFGIETAIIFEQMRTYEGYFLQADTSHFYADQLEFGENGLADWYSVEQWIRLNYLSFPLGVEFRLNRWRFGVGGQYSCLLKVGGASHQIMGDFQDDYSPFHWVDDFYFHKRHNISAYASVGFKVWENLNIEIIYLEGLVDISQEIFDHRYWTRQFQFGLSYEIWPRDKKEKGIDEGLDD